MKKSFFSSLPFLKGRLFLVFISFLTPFGFLFGSQKINSDYTIDGSESPDINEISDTSSILQKGVIYVHYGSIISTSKDDMVFGEIVNLSAENKTEVSTKKKAKAIQKKITKPKTVVKEPENKKNIHFSQAVAPHSISVLIIGLGKYFVAPVVTFLQKLLLQNIEFFLGIFLFYFLVLIYSQRDTSLLSHFFSGKKYLRPPPKFSNIKY